MSNLYLPPDFVTPVSLKTEAERAALDAEVRSSLVKERRLASVSQGRPGELRDRYTSNLTGDRTGGELQWPVVSGPRGLALRVTGSAVVAQRDRINLADGSTFSVSVMFSKIQNSTDPVGDAVVVGVQWLGASMEAVSQSIVVSAPYQVSSGHQVVRYSLSAAFGDGEIKAPSGAVYAVPFVQTFGADGQYLLEQIEMLPVLATTSSDQSGALAVLKAELAAGQSIAAREATELAALSQGHFDSVSDAEQAHSDGDLPEGSTFTVVDGPDAQYYRIVSGAGVPLPGMRVPLRANFDTIAVKVGSLETQIGERWPMVGTVASVSVAPDGTWTGYLDIVTGLSVVIDGEQTRGLIYQIPLVGLLGSASITPDGKILAGLTIDGEPVAINSAGLPTGGLGDVWTEHDLSTGRRAPSNGVDALFPVYGQSLAKGTIDGPFYDASTPNHPTAFLPGQAIMPDFGHVFPISADWDGWEDLKEGKHPTDPDTVETMCSGFAEKLWEEWTETFGALPGVRTAHVVHAAGGRSIRGFGPGSPDMAILLAHVTRSVRASLAEGRKLVVPAVLWSQGEADRASIGGMNPRQRARELKELQEALDAEIRAITGQRDRVALVCSIIQRNNDLSGPIAGALLAADGDGLVFVGAANYAAEYNTTGTHPAVEGYHRLGRAFARAVVDGVLGADYRPPRATAGYPISETVLRVDVELPEGAALVMDTSGDLIDTEDLSPTYGWRVWDRTGVLTITDVALVSGGIEITLSGSPDWPSLEATYAHSAASVGGGNGGRLGPRGPFRANDGAAVSGLTAHDHSWLLPAYINLKGTAL